MGDHVARWLIRVLAIFLMSSLSWPVTTFAQDAAEHETIAAMVARVSSAVVRVVTVRPAPPQDAKPGATVVGVSATNRTSTSSGSGFIIDPSGYTATNKHVVDGAISVFVVTADGIRYPAAIIGMPAEADIALLRIDSGRKRFPFVHFGDSDKMRVGDKVVAIGSPFGFDQTATAGIISAVNRNIMESPFDDYLQTDAAINHGNSGGPLFNMSGEVIGMTSVIYSPDAGSSGIGFAVPASSLRFVFDRLMTTGKINAGMLPIFTQEVTWMLGQALDLPDLRGALVTSVQDRRGMMQGKIQAGDVIRSFNGETVLDPRDLARKAARARIGSDVVLERCRGGEIENVRVTIGAWPEATPTVLIDDDHGPLGLQLAAARNENGQSIVVVDAVGPAGTAAASGIRKGDIIVQVQQTTVTEPDQALRILWTRSYLRRRFAAVLLERDKKLAWMSIAVPE